MRISPQSYEENQICLALTGERKTDLAQERMYNLAILNTEQDIVHKVDFTDIIDFTHSCKNQEKTVLSALF